MTSQTTWTYPAEVVRVVDGDTVRLILDLGLHLTRTENCRIGGINAPETSTPEGRAAAAHAATLLHPGDRVTFLSERLDKYGRPLGSLTLGSGADLATEMLVAGHAVPYNP